MSEEKNGHRIDFETFTKTFDRREEEFCECDKVAKWYCRLWPWPNKAWPGCKREETQE